MTDGPLAGKSDAASADPTSAKNSLTTPRDLFDRLNAKRHYTLDAAASHENALVDRYCTVDGFFDGGGRILLRDELISPDGIKIAETWCPEDGVVFVNCPYGKGLIAPFIAAWATAARERGVESDFLIPANKTEQPWWHEWVWDNATGSRRPWVTGIEFIEGRVKYGGLDGAPFPSCVVSFGPEYGI